jgi:hypothetical protein
LFRVSGDATEVSALKQAFETTDKVDMTHASPHAVTGVLKMFLRELSEPLFTFEEYENFLTAWREVRTIMSSMSLLSIMHAASVNHVLFCQHACRFCQSRMSLLLIMHIASVNHYKPCLLYQTLTLYYFLFLRFLRRCRVTSTRSTPSYCSLALPFVPHTHSIYYYPS